MFLLDHLNSSVTKNFVHEPISMLYFHGYCKPEIKTLRIDNFNKDTSIDIDTTHKYWYIENGFDRYNRNLINDTPFYIIQNIIIVYRQRYERRLENEPVAFSPLIKCYKNSLLFWEKILRLFTKKPQVREKNKTSATEERHELTKIKKERENEGTELEDRGFVTTTTSQQEKNRIRMTSLSTLILRTNNRYPKTFLYTMKIKE